MQLLSDWKQIVKKAWSIRLAVLAGVLSALEVLLPLYADSVPRGAFAGLSVFVITGAMVARVVAQKDLHVGHP